MKTLGIVIVTLLIRDGHFEKIRIEKTKKNCQSVRLFPLNLHGGIMYC